MSYCDGYGPGPVKHQPVVPQLWEKFEHAPFVENTHCDTRMREGVRTHETGRACADDEDVYETLRRKREGHGGSWDRGGGS